MVACTSLTIRSLERLSHAEAGRLAQLAGESSAQTIILDLSGVLEATTAAFARLVLLRRELLPAGRDVRLAGLRGQPAKLLEVHRLQSILPSVSEWRRASAVPTRSEYCRPAIASAPFKSAPVCC